MPKIIDDAADELSNYISVSESSNRKILWDLGIQFVLLYMGFSLLKGIFLFFTRQTIIVMSRNIEFDLKNEIFSKYQQLNLAFYKQNRTGDLMNRISEDVTKVRMYLGPAIMYTLNVIVLFVLVVSFMLLKNASLTLYVLFPLPILSLIIYKVSSTINKKSEIVQKKQSKITSFVQEAFSGIRVLKAYNRANYFSSLYEDETENYKKASLSLALVTSLFIPAIIMLIGLSTIITIYLGGLKTINNELDYGDILQFIFYINMLTWPFASVGWVSSLVQRAAASQKRINEFLLTQQTIVNNGEIKMNQIESIKFKNLAFNYPTGKDFNLENISFEISKGKSLGIFGETGSGKSTIAQLICRLYEVENEVSIQINNNHLIDIELNSYREKIGYVPQDVFLFSDSIKHNIAFGLDENTYQFSQIEKAAKQAGILKEIKKFPEGFDTKIGERGVTLSGGQKQRIAIARALIRNPDILIFDDSLSAVDTETANEIQRELINDSNEQLSIHISHRINLLSNCDHIIVIENGKIIEQGNHDQLSKNNGFYQQIFKKQQLEEN
jgi:ATP-binding cassette subfamily B protein